MVTPDVELETLGVGSLATGSILADIEETSGIVVHGKENCSLKKLTKSRTLAPQNCL